MKQVLITGASSELMQQTIKGLDDYAFKGISRQIRTDERIQYVQGDLSDLDFLTEAVKGVDIIVHAA